MKGNILIVSGPSGSGKSSLMIEMFKKIENTYFSISTTTRDIRDGEKDGENYYYISKDEFKKDIEEDMFLEWAKVHDNYYGTSLKPILKALEEGKLVVFDIDVQGHKIAREKFSDLITSVFLTTKNQDVLKQRLIKRGTDSENVIEKRLNNAVSEMSRMSEYDYLLVNDDFENTLEKLTSIAISLKSKVRTIDTEKFITSWV